MGEAERPAGGHCGPQAPGEGAPDTGGGGAGGGGEKGPSLVCLEGGAGRRRCWTGCDVREIRVKQVPQSGVQVPGRRVSLNAPGRHRANWEGNFKGLV